MTPDECTMAVGIAAIAWWLVALVVDASAGWVWLFPILLMVPYCFVLAAWQTERNISDATARRVSAIEAAKKPLPKLDPDQVSLSKAGLIK
jgi:hypothetical protein